MTCCSAFRPGRMSVAGRSRMPVAGGYHGTRTIGKKERVLQCPKLASQAQGDSLNIIRIESTSGGFVPHQVGEFLQQASRRATCRHRTVPPADFPRVAQEDAGDLLHGVSPSFACRSILHPRPLGGQCSSPPHACCSQAATRVPALALPQRQRSALWWQRSQACWKLAENKYTLPARPRRTVAALIRIAAVSS